MDIQYVSDFCTKHRITVTALFNAACVHWYETAMPELTRRTLEDFTNKQLVPYWVDEYIRHINARGDNR